MQKFGILLKPQVPETRLPAPKRNAPKQYAPVHRTGAQGVGQVEGEPAPLQNFQYSAMTSISQRSFLGSSRTATQDRAGLPVKYSP